jgi:hypothetical protein
MRLFPKLCAGQQLSHLRQVEHADKELAAISPVSSRSRFDLGDNDVYTIAGLLGELPLHQSTCSWI